MADLITPPTAPSAPAPPQSPPPEAPKPQEERHNPSRIGPMIGFLALVLIICALLFLKNPWFNVFPKSPTPPPETTLTPPAPATAPVMEPINQATSTPPIAATSTEPNATSSLPFVENTTSTHFLGDTVVFFLNDDHVFVDRADAQRSFVVTAIEFTDSRCQPGVQCIWAGERGVRLHVINQHSGQAQDVSLGTVRTKTANALTLKFTLQSIDDGKGGTYATITVE